MRGGAGAELRIPFTPPEEHMPDQQPSVGRVVHFVSHPIGDLGPRCRAAIVTDVWPQHDANIPALAVLEPTGIAFHTAVYQDESEKHAPGTWHWPERV